MRSNRNRQHYYCKKTLRSGYDQQNSTHDALCVLLLLASCLLIPGSWLLITVLVIIND